MVEMKEACHALSNATSKSLIIFDELGRGTATYDGMSLAEAILEYINENIKALTLFSTHYHELTTMDKKYKTIKNVHVEAIEDNGKVTFLHKVKDGSTPKSYGIHVARLAKMPEPLLQRAEEILSGYESESKKIKDDKVQLSFDFTSSEVKQDDELKNKILAIDPIKMTPMEALNYLYDLKESLKK